MMRSVKVKLAGSVLLAVLILAALPMVGVTETSADSREGVMLDFGYWNVEWIEKPLAEGMDGAVRFIYRTDAIE